MDHEEGVTHLLGVNSIDVIPSDQIHQVGRPARMQMVPRLSEERVLLSI